MNRSHVNAINDTNDINDINDARHSLHALEQLLCDAEQAGQPFSPAVCAENDRLEQFPAAAAQLLDQFGLPAYYVPAAHGGRLRSFAELVQLWRAVARRDITAAVGHGKTFLGAACVWVANDPGQARRIGGDVAKGVVVSWGLTERHHGSDLLAGELTATPTASGWRLQGEKWLINNATRGQILCALTRTGSTGGPRGFSLFLLDKRELPADQYHYLPKERLHGIRGADISGIAYTQAEVGPQQLVGKLGQGVEIVLKALQLSRTTCVALSLGAADHALRLAYAFCAERRMYERRLLELPLVQRQLGEIVASLLVVEAVGIVASRTIEALPGEMSVIAALAKAFVPSTVDTLIGAAGELLGARAFLMNDYAHGMFQKLERDHRIVAIFDGSTVVNRNSLINQFRGLARAWQSGKVDGQGVAQACDLARSLPPFAPEQLCLLSGGGCSLVQSWPAALGQLTELTQLAQLPQLPQPAHAGEAGAALDNVLRLAQALDGCVQHVMQDMAQYQPSPRDVPPEAFDLARRYELCFAAAACLQLWLHNRVAANNAGWWRDALWVQAGLLHLLCALQPETVGDGALYDGLTAQLMASRAVDAGSPPVSSVSLASLLTDLPQTESA
jgi:alkylation response protein AidB-like acyl-CoA dehydrogenase